MGLLPKTEKGNKYLIVATDNLSMWCEVKVSKNKSATEIAKFIYNEIICKHGAPANLLSEFSNKIVSALCEIVNTIKCQSLAYHPQCNCSVERLNRDILSKLMKMCNGSCEKWNDYLNTAFVFV